MATVKVLLMSSSLANIAHKWHAFPLRDKEGALCGIRSPHASKFAVVFSLVTRLSLTVERERTGWNRFKTMSMAIGIVRSHTTEPLNHYKAVRLEI
ncbi:hypothetical protein CEXT_628661 [Caerostris extrusa]|uniref:Uncharacterized protein n=1 Tax=Caerostris extrusa TaxID=172846 RepID=A0AAV4U6S3_CAEEX|nr:hypothetical protein CEXT_628661 [Caerostris extrusa]